MVDLAQYLETSLLPSPQNAQWNNGAAAAVPLSTTEKVKHYVQNAGCFVVAVASLPFVALYSLGVRLFSAPPAPEEVKEVPVHSALPAHFGFADSLFQTSGLGTFASATDLEGLSDWDEWLNPERIEGTNGADYRRFFVDVLQNPAPFVALLKKMGVSAHRFSLEWAVLEPEKGKLNEKAVALYRNFIQTLKKEGIEPYVTLHHFVVPRWFNDQNGGFALLENVDSYVSHALKMIDLFPEVTNWMTFNEPGVYAMQSHLRGCYPPGVKGDIAATGRVARNLLIAHCKTYQAAKEKHGDKIQIGITHQWLKFVPLEGNPIERLVCYTMSKICHYSVYNFFKTGQFSVEVPLQANVHFSIPEAEFDKNNRFLDFIGVQYYGFPHLKIGFNGGHSYPGETVNFPRLHLSFGSTCYPGGKAQSFGPGYFPELLEVALKEAAALGKPVAITETGCDARIQKWGETSYGIDEETQRQYYKDIVPILQRFQGQMKAFFAWTLVRRHLEWDRGAFPLLGTVDILKSQDQQLLAHRLSPAAQEIQRMYREKQREMEEVAAAG